MSTTTKKTFCRICESLCGLEVQIEDGRIQKIVPDNDHVATRGFACPKGLKQHHMYNSPDRLRQPMKRTGDSWGTIPWDQALEEIGAKIRQLHQDHGPESIGMYVGTAAGFSVLHPVFAQGFMQGIGSNNLFASATQDCSNKFAVSERMYGFPFTQPFPDLEKTRCMIVVGANPVVSKWSFLQVPNPSLHLKEMERRGCKIYFVDPRRTESAKVAGTHVFIRPGTDVYFYLAFLHELIKQGGVDQARVEAYMDGYETIEQLARDWSAERAEEVTQMPAGILRQMVADYIAAKGASIYCSTGVNMGGNGVLAFWIQECINAISGNLDREGGTLIGKGVIDFAKFGSKNGILMRKDRSRIGDLPSVNDAFPGGILADEILTPGNKKIRAMIVTGGNPLITMANSNRLREAFQNLELLITLDILPNETGSVGHYMLPCTSPLERPDLPFIFPLMLGLQTKPYLQATRKVEEPDGEQRDEATIYYQLAKASGLPLFGSKIAQGFFGLLFRWKNRSRKKGQQPSLPQEFILNLLLRVTGQKSFRSLLRKPSGLLRHPHQAESFLGKRVYTSNGRIQLAPENLLDQVKAIELRFFRELEEQDQLRLITKRAVTTHNSWTHNFSDFVANERYTNYLYMHPLDAERRGLKNKQLVDVQSASGRVRLTLKILADLMPGTVALPHGWGHQSSLQGVANKTEGVNVNILAGDGPQRLEKYSGMARLTAIPVEVSAAEGPRSDSWSGLAEDMLDVGTVLGSKPRN